MPRTALQILVLALLAAIGPAAAGGVGASPAGTWTLIIPEAFPGIVYKWRIAATGTYEEDAWVRETGEPYQQTLRGTWTVEGNRLTLRQDGIPYAFEGLVSADRYWGTLYLGGRDVSGFCATKGDTPPDRCDETVAARAEREGAS